MTSLLKYGVIVLVYILIDREIREVSLRPSSQKILGSTNATTDVNRSMREQSHSANTENIVNHDVDKVDKLQQEFNELKQILYTHVLQNSANNKNVEKYNSVISENLTTTTGVQNKKGHKTNNKRKERRK